MGKEGVAEERLCGGAVVDGEGEEVEVGEGGDDLLCVFCVYVVVSKIVERGRYIRLYMRSRFNYIYIHLYIHPDWGGRGIYVRICSRFNDPL